MRPLSSKCKLLTIRVTPGTVARLPHSYSHVDSLDTAITLQVPPFHAEGPVCKGRESSGPRGCVCGTLS